MSEEIFVEECIRRHGNVLIPILQDIQEKHNYLPESSMRLVAEKLSVSLRDVYGVASFYQAFSFQPKGKHIITVCLGTACHVRGGKSIVDALMRELGLKTGESTKDLKFTLETVNCLGCCAIGPIMEINGEYHGQMTANKAVQMVKKIAKEEHSG